MRDYIILARGQDGAAIQEIGGNCFHFGHPFKGIWLSEYKDFSDEELIKVLFGPDANLVQEINLETTSSNLDV